MKDSDIIEQATRILRKGGTSYGIERKMQQIDQLYRKDICDRLVAAIGKLDTWLAEEANGYPAVALIKREVEQAIKQELQSDE